MCPRNRSLLFYFILTPIAAVLLFFLLETACRVYDVGEKVSAHLHLPSQINIFMEQDDITFQEIKRLIPPPDCLPWHAPPENTVCHLDDRGCQELAQQRNELIIVSDEEGTFYEVYPCTATLELAYLSQKVHIGDNIKDILPYDMAMDTLNTIQRTKDNALEWIHHYTLPATDNDSYIYDFRCMPVHDLPLRFALFFSTSVYQDIYKRYRPNSYCDDYKQDFLHSMFWTNSIGLRDREITLPKPPGVFRILCIGGSTTVEGPHNELTYPKYLERMLRERLNTNAIEVVNCGVDAATLSTEYDRFPEFLALEPDMILHYNIINDLPAITQAAGDNAGLKSGLMGQLRVCGSYSMLLRTLFENWFVPPVREVEEEITGQAMSIIGKMNDTARKKGVTFVACSFALPDIQKLSSRETIFFDNSFWSSYLIPFSSRYYKQVVECHNALLLRFCTENHIPYIPVAEHLKGGMDLFSDICHLRIPGIEKKAEIICEHLAPHISLTQNAPQ